MSIQTILKYQNKDINKKTQQKLNKPLADDTGFNEGHENFLTNLIEKIKSKELDIHNPETLYNHNVFGKLQEEQQEKTSLTAINIMSVIRQIESLWNIEQKATFQIQNLVETVFQMKSKFEKEHGDVYVI